MWMTIKVNKDSSEVKLLMEKVINEESKVAKEEKIEEMQVDLQVEETTVGDHEDLNLKKEGEFKVKNLLDKKIRNMFSIEEKIDFVLRTFKVVTF